MTNSEIKWENYGDANPLEYGGIFLKSDKEVNGDDFTGCYYVEELNKCPDTGKFVINSGYIDINDSWINKDAVKECCDTPEDDELRFVLDCIYYYGGQEFGIQKVANTEEQVKEYFKDLGIKL